MRNIEYNGDMYSKEQLSAAMAVAELSVSGLAKKTGFARNTVIKFLSCGEDKMNQSTVNSIMFVIIDGITKKNWRFSEGGILPFQPSE